MHRKLRLLQIYSSDLLHRPFRGASPPVFNPYPSTVKIAVLFLPLCTFYIPAHGAPGCGCGALSGSLQRAFRRPASGRAGACGPQPDTVAGDRRPEAARKAGGMPGKSHRRLRVSSTYDACPSPPRHATDKNCHLPRYRVDAVGRKMRARQAKKTKSEPG